METLETIKNRRSIKKYLDKPVEFEKITTILDAARKAPSAGNLQGWRFIIVTEKNLIKEISKICIEQYWIETAPVLIVVCISFERYEMYYGLRGKRLYAIQDCSAAIQNILLSSTDLGLGSCWVGGFEEEKLKSLLSIPADVRPQAIITLGYSDEVPNDRSLIPLENICFFNRYGMKIEKLHIVLRDYSVEWQNQAKNLKNRIKPKINRTFESLKELSKKLNEKIKKK